MTTRADASASIDAEDPSVAITHTSTTIRHTDQCGTRHSLGLSNGRWSTNKSRNKSCKASRSSRLLRRCDDEDAAAWSSDTCNSTTPSYGRFEDGRTTSALTEHNMCAWSDTYRADPLERMSGANEEEEEDEDEDEVTAAVPLPPWSGCGSACKTYGRNSVFRRPSPRQSARQPPLMYARSD